MLLLEIVAVILTLSAVYLISKPKILGLHLGIAANVLWIVFSLINSFFFMAGQAVIMTCFNVYGIRNWKKRGIK